MNNNQTKEKHQETSRAREQPPDLCLNSRNFGFFSISPDTVVENSKVGGFGGGSERLSINPKEIWRLSCAELEVFLLS